MKLFIAATLLLLSVFGSTEYDDTFLANAEKQIEAQFVMPMYEEQIISFAEKYHNQMLETKNNYTESYNTQIRQILDQAENVVNINSPVLYCACAGGLLYLHILKIQNDAWEIPSVETITRRVEQDQRIMKALKEILLKFLELEQIKHSLEKDNAHKELMKNPLLSLLPQGTEMNFQMAVMLFVVLQELHKSMERMKMYVSADVLTI